MNIHHFESTGAAYNATQCNLEILPGDVLVIESERVVGIADTWPFALSLNMGDLHGLQPDADPDLLYPGYAEGIAKAREIIAEKGWDKPLRRYTFDLELLTSITVEATSEAEARSKLCDHMNGASANFGVWSDTGEPVLAEVGLDDSPPELSDVDGEDPT